MRARARVHGPIRLESFIGSADLRQDRRVDDPSRELLASLRSRAGLPTPTPWDAMLDFWRKAFIYSGRATRFDYNWALLMFLVASSGASALFE